MRLPLWCLLALLSTLAGAQVHVWTKRMGTGIREKAKFMQMFTDDVALCALESDGQVVLVRFNFSTGEKIWTKTLGPGEVAGMVCDSRSDCYLVCNGPSGVARLFRIKNLDGSIIWQRPVLSDGLGSSSRAVQLTKDYYEPSIILAGERDGQAVIARYDIYSNEQYLVNVSGKSVTAVASNSFYTSVGDGRAYAGQLYGGVLQSEIEVTPSGRFVEQCEVSSRNGDTLRVAIISRDSNGRQFLDVRTPFCDSSDWDVYGTHLIPSGFAATIFHDSGVRHSMYSETVPLQIKSSTGTVQSQLVSLKPNIGPGYYEVTNVPYFQHEGGLASVWLAGTKRDIAVPSTGFHQDGGLGQEDIPVSGSLEHFLVTTVTGPNSSQARLMRIHFINSFSYPSVIGGSTCVLGFHLGRPAAMDFELRLSVPAGSPVSVQPTFLVKKGDRILSIPVQTHPCISGTRVTVTVDYHGFKVESWVTVFAPRVSAVVLTSNYGRGGDTKMGRILLSGPAAAGGFLATISDSSGLIGTPSTVTVPEGQSEVEFPIVCFSPRATTAVSIRAEGGLGSLTKTFTLLRPELTAVSTNVPSIKGGLSLASTVTLDSPAPGGGFVVDITTTGAILPAVPVTVQTGQRSMSFTLRTSSVTSDTSSTITASLNGRTRSVTVLIKP